MYVIKKINKITKELIAEWNKLWNECDNKNYFNSYTWFENYVNAFDIKRYTIVIGYSHNKLCFVLPLVFKRRKYITIGGKYLDKVSFLFKGDPDKYIIQLRDFAIKNKMSIILNECNFNIPSSKKIYIEKASDNPYIKLSENIKNIIKPKERRHIENVIKNNSDLSFEIFAKKECSKVINTIFDIESKSHKVKEKKALFNLEQAKSLFRNLANTDFCIIAILYFKYVPIAHMVGINNCDKIFMAYHMAYDMNYRHIQPGKIVIYDLIKYLQERQFEIFDFSRGNSILKRHFSNYSESQYNIYLNPSVKIKFELLYRRMCYRVKKVIKKTRR